MRYRTFIDCVAPGVCLEDVQALGVVRALLEKKMLLAYDTGLGKTFIAAVYLRALLNANQVSKHIMIVLKDQDIQTPATIKSITGAEVLFSDASQKSLERLYKRWDKTNIFLLTYDCFQNTEFVYFLFTHLMDITSLVIDEAHLAANWNSSNMAWIIRAFAGKIEYVLALTATPITSNKAQFPRLRNMLNRNITYRRYEVMSDNEIHKGYLQISRKDIGVKGNYTTKIIWCTPMVHQIGDIKGNIFAVTKGSGAKNQVDALIKILRNNVGKKILIYVHYHDSREWLEENLKATGFSFVSLHGRIHNRQERKSILEQFNNGDVNILITSVTTALDISADVILFYEYTTSVKQMIGRPHRGYVPKDLSIYFFITKDTGEVEFFSKYIYYRSVEIQKLLGKDYSEILSIGDELLEASRL